MNHLSITFHQSDQWSIGKRDLQRRETSHSLKNFNYSKQSVILVLIIVRKICLLKKMPPVIFTRCLALYWMNIFSLSQSKPACSCDLASIVSHRTLIGWNPLCFGPEDHGKIHFPSVTVTLQILWEFSCRTQILCRSE